VESIFVVEYFREYESTYIQTDFVHESVDPGVLLDEKTRGRKSREVVPLSLSIIVSAFLSPSFLPPFHLDFLLLIPLISPYIFQNDSNDKMHKSGVKKRNPFLIAFCLM
jgi:hypothetical protein